MLYDLVTLKISLIVFYAISFNRIRSHSFLKHAVLQLLSWPWHQEGRKEAGCRHLCEEAPQQANQGRFQQTGEHLNELLVQI